MKLKRQDQISAEIVQISSNNVMADASAFSNIKQIRVTPQVAETVLSPGKELVVEVEAIDDGVAQVKQVQAAYRRQHWPGDTVEVTAKTLLKKGVSRAELTAPKNLEYVIVPGMVPEETAQVELVKTRDRIGFAKVIERVSAGIQVGDEVDAQIPVAGEHATAQKGSYEIQLDTYAPVPDTVKVEVTRIDEQVHGTIVQPSTYPISGATVNGTVVQGETQVQINGYQATATLDAPAKASGPVSLTIESAIDSGIRAQIDEYGTALPREDETVSATVTTESQTAEASIDELTVDITLNYRPPLDGKAMIEIVQVNGVAYAGTLVKYTDKPIAPGKTHSGQVYTNSNRVITEPGGRSIYLTHNVETAGHADVKITYIEDKIYGEIVGEINDEIKRRTQKKQQEKFIGSKNSLLNKSSL